MKSEMFATAGSLGQCEIWAYHSSADGDAGNRELQALWIGKQLLMEGPCCLYLQGED